MKVNKPGYSTQVEMRPHFQHDCTECIYLGSAEVNTVKVDFYAHKHKPFGGIKRHVDLIYRTSSEGSDYGCTHPQYCSPLSLFSVMALSLYVKYLGANGTNAMVRGHFSKDGNTVLLIK